MKKVINFLILFSGVTAFSPAWADKACFEVQGMTCATCPLTVKTAIKKLKGINNVKTSLEEKNAIVDFDVQKINSSEIKKAIENSGYKAVPQECKKIKG